MSLPTVLVVLAIMLAPKSLPNLLVTLAIIMLVHKPLKPTTTFPDLRCVWVQVSHKRRTIHCGSHVNCRWRIVNGCYP